MEKRGGRGNETGALLGHGVGSAGQYKISDPRGCDEFSKRFGIQSHTWMEKQILQARGLEHGDKTSMSLRATDHLEAALLERSRSAPTSPLRNARPGATGPQSASVSPKALPSGARADLLRRSGLSSPATSSAVTTVRDSDRTLRQRAQSSLVARRVANGEEGSGEKSWGWARGAPSRKFVGTLSDNYDFVAQGQKHVAQLGVLLPRAQSSPSLLPDEGLSMLERSFGSAQFPKGPKSNTLRYRETDLTSQVYGAALVDAEPTVPIYKVQGRKRTASSIIF